jgi:hypothetical protein
MYTIRYKGWFIHGDCADAKIMVQSPDYAIIRVKSVLAAKLYITKHA